MAIEFFLYFRTKRTDDELLEIISKALPESRLWPENERDPALIEKGGLVIWIKEFDRVIGGGGSGLHPIVEDFQIEPNTVCVFRRNPGTEERVRPLIAGVVDKLLQLEDSDAVLTRDDQGLLWRKGGKTVVSDSEQAWDSQDLKYFHLPYTRGPMPAGW